MRHYRPPLSRRQWKIDLWNALYSIRRPGSDCHCELRVPAVLVDGQLTGTQNFQVIAGAGATDIPSPPALAVVPPSPLYERALASTVSIENRNAQGQILNTGAGFFIAQGLVVTAFQVIDGASTLRVSTLGGKKVGLKDVATWNRRQHWAVLAMANSEAPPLGAASSSSPVVGDRCYFLEVSAPGSPIIVTTSIAGKNTIPDAGARNASPCPQARFMVKSQIRNRDARNQNEFTAGP